MIKTINFEADLILSDIIKLHTGPIDCDVTYSKGQFYKSGFIKRPALKFDLHPQTPDTVKAEASKLPLQDQSIGVLMFDPPFICGQTTPKNTGKIGTRFTGFPYVKDLWSWYDSCLVEFSRVLKPKGFVIFKCQDTVSGSKQFWSHNHILQSAERCGFYGKDLFVLLARSRMVGHNHHTQQHARKFHSYFWVLQKKGVQK